MIAAAVTEPQRLDAQATGSPQATGLCPARVPGLPSGLLSLIVTRRDGLGLGLGLQSPSDWQREAPGSLASSFGSPPSEEFRSSGQLWYSRPSRPPVHRAGRRRRLRRPGPALWLCGRCQVPGHWHVAPGLPYPRWPTQATKPCHGSERFSRARTGRACGRVSVSANLRRDPVAQTFMRRPLRYLRRQRGACA